jgi:AbrB family looped-hinge helix DNA binding protein
MSTLTITTKGQVTLRKDLLEHLGVHPGEKIAVEKLPDGRIEVKAARPTGKISDLFGSLKDKKKGPTLSIEEMNEVIAKGGPASDEDYGRYQRIGAGIPGR